MSYSLSEEQQNFLHKIINFEGPNVLFVTGSAGTGKSTLLHAVQDYDEDTIVLAPTGIAAIQAKGQTIHSFFGLKPNSSVSKMRNDSVKALKNANRIIIDEISMVRSDLMELMNSIMQSKLKNRLPFGGIPMIVFGDQSQIEPVVKEDEIDFDFTSFKEACLSNRMQKFDNKEILKLLKTLKLNLVNEFLNTRQV